MVRARFQSLVIQLASLLVAAALPGCMPIWHATFSNTLDVPVEVRVFSHPSGNLFSRTLADAHSRGRALITFGRMTARTASGKLLGKTQLKFTESDRQKYATSDYELYFSITGRGFLPLPPGNPR